MILRPWNAEAFREYARPLERLEKDLRKAGNFVILYALRDTFGNRFVRAIHKRNAKKFVCIEGKSPAQAIKAVKKAAGA